HLPLANQEVQWMGRIRYPLATVIDRHQSLHANPPRARCHAARLDGLAVGTQFRILPLDAWIAPHALLAGTGVGSVDRLLVWAGFHATLVSAASRLVDQDDAVLWALVDCLSRTGSQ